MKNKDRNVQYFVEGEDEKKLVNTLKNDLKVIIPGKVQTLNATQKIISDLVLRTFKKGTIVVLVFDTDTANLNILNSNIKKLEKCTSVSEIITIPQVRNLEDELVYSCNIKKITELLNSRSVSDFKSEFIHITNLGSKLKEHCFDIIRFWSRNPGAPYQEIVNKSNRVKLL